MASTFESDARRVYWLRKEAKAMEDEAKEILDKYQLDNRDYPAGDFIVKVTPTVRFDPATAKRNLPTDKYESILRLKPDTTAAKALLTEDEYKMAQKEHGQTIKIVPVTDEED